MPVGRNSDLTSFSACMVQSSWWTATDVDLRLAFFSPAGSVAFDAQVVIQVLMGAGYVESVALTE
jgi:hypothetical protein